MRDFGTIAISFFVLAGSFISPAMAQSLQPASVDLMQWPRMDSPSFGCYMEKTFGHRDPRFNCSLKGYENKGDPCKNTDAYYEGPAFPGALASKVQPQVKDIDLSWEHGELQMVAITVTGEYSDQDVQRAFKLPSPVTDKAPAGNVMSVDIDHGNRGVTVISLTGFDHQGAGDVDCGG